MALDYGEQRVGVAVTDSTGQIAQPLETIVGSDRDAQLRRVVELAAEYEVSRIVVGLPLHMDGREGEQAKAARTFGKHVAERTDVAVDFLDERWTSIEAERALRETGGRKGKAREKSDPVAAAILLRSYLERSA